MGALVQRASAHHPYRTTQAQHLPHQAQVFHQLERSFERYSRERLALAEKLAVAVVMPVVGFFEVRIEAHLSGQYAAGQRKPHDDTHIICFSHREKPGYGVLTEQVESVVFKEKIQIKRFK